MDVEMNKLIVQTDNDKPNAPSAMAGAYKW